MGCLAAKTSWGERMIGDYNQYVDQYIRLISMTCLKPEDYTKDKVKTNNKVMPKLKALCDEIDTDIELAGKVYSKLMHNEDRAIQLRAAGVCLKLNLHIEKAVEILERLTKTGNPWYSMPAERALKIWRGEIGPDDPG